MFDGITRSESLGHLQRAEGKAQVGFERRAGATRLAHLYQQGCAKIRLPKIHDRAPEAVVLNTAGGLTGGDHLVIEASLAEGTEAVVTTQACERIYKSAGGVAEAVNRLTVGEEAVAHWLPQETILFDGSGLRRSFEIALKPGARVIAIESVVFGRAAMGEIVKRGFFHDSWRITRAGTLIYADETRITGEIASALDGPVTLGGNEAMATLVMVAPEAKTKLEQARALLDGETAGVSLVRDDLLVARLVGASSQALRSPVEALITLLRDGAPLPRVWHI